MEWVQYSLQRPPAPDIQIREPIEEGVKRAIETRMKEQNTLWNEDGIRRGFLIDTIEIDRIVPPIAGNKVEITASIQRIATRGHL